MASRRVVLFVALGIAAALVADFHFVYRSPSLELIAFVNRVTANSLPSPPATVGGGAVPPPPVPEHHHSESPASEKPNFRNQRFNAKLHMVNEVQLFVDYPLAYWLTVDLDLAAWPFLTANLVSILHPFFGVAAGYFIIKANGGFGKDDAPASQAKTTAGKATPGSPSAANSSAQKADIELHPLIIVNSQSTSNLLGSTANVISPSAFNASSTTHLGSPVPTTSPCIPSGSIANEACMFDEASQTDPELAQKEAAGSRMFSSVNVKNLRIGAVLFWVRNYLDTMDGVVARVQRNRVGVVHTSTSLGFNGHSLDMLTDTLGVACIGVGILYLLFSKNLMLSRIPSAILVRLGFRGHLGKKDQALSKMVAVAGLLYILLTGTFWETFMLRYANLFDTHANTNPALFELDNNFAIRLSQFLWSLSCGDALLGYLMVAIFFNKIWEALQVFAFFGIPWCLTLSAYSFWVWRSVVMADPTASLIIAENPELFI
jgi:hypothetical protein